MVKSMIKTISNFSIIAAVASLGVNNAVAYEHDMDYGDDRGSSSFYAKLLLGFTKQNETASLKWTGEGTKLKTPAGTVFGQKDTKYKHDWSFTGGAYFGYKMTDSVALEVGYDYVKNNISQIAYTNSFDPTSGSSPTANDNNTLTQTDKNNNSNDIGYFKSHLVSSNVVFSFNSQSEFSLYAGAGVLMFIKPELQTKFMVDSDATTSSVTKKAVTEDYKNDDFTFGFRGIIGAKYRATEDVSVVAEFRYNQSFEFDFADQATSSKKKISNYKYTDMSIYGGILVHF